MAEIKSCEWCNEAVLVVDDIFHHLTIKDNKNCLEKRSRERMATDRDVCVNYNVVDGMDAN